MTKWLYGFFILLFSFEIVHGQKVLIHGKIVDESTNEPIPYANLFINQTTIGTSTNDVGYFKLEVPTGKLELAVSHVGYEFSIQTLMVEKSIDIGTIQLLPNNTQLDEVVVQSKEDRNWERNLRTFEKIVLGEYALSRQARIVNPWVLEFEDQGKETLMTATLPLQVSNDYLGYDIKLFLKRSALNAMGYEIFASVYFSEKTPSSPQDSYRWAANRRTAYTRSSRYLFKSIIDKKISGNGFRLYTDNPGGNQANTYLEGTDNFRRAYGSSIIDYDTVGMFSKSGSGTWTIAINGRLEVHYQKTRSVIRAYEDIGFPVSWLAVRGALLTVDEAGVPLNPQNLITSGDMNSNWLVRLLPSDYRPPENPSIEFGSWDIEALRERFYLHCDKPHYVKGETIWYKVYVDFAKQSLRDSLSRVLYVDLISPQSDIVVSQSLAINNGFAYGELAIPDSLPSGNYFLRAYTNLSLNFGEDNIYQKAIPIVNVEDKIVSKQPYRKPPDSGVSIEADKSSFAPRDKITLNIETRDSHQNPIAAHLSISVVDQKQVSPIMSDDIVECFQMAERSIVIPDELKFPIENGIALHGTVEDKKGRGKKAVVTLVDWQTKQMYQFETETDGTFDISGLDFFGSRAFVFEARDRKNRPLDRVTLIPRKAPAIVLPKTELNFQITRTDIPQRMLNTYKLTEGTKILDEVIIEDGRIDMPKFRSTYGRPDRVLEEKDINKSYPSIIYSIYKIIPEGRVLRSGNLSVLNQADMLVTINDVPVTGDPTSTLSMIDPNTVERVEVTTRLNVLYGSQAVAGVIAVYLKQGSDTAYEPKETATTSIVEGFTRVNRFASPDYSVSPDDLKSDFRSTVYWNPEVITDPITGKGTVTFYAADLETTYRVVVEGMNSENAPVRGEYTLTINKP
ncbi:MAG TPA: carboxypeptidase-like regulatory domain-containing protein [Cyclobacteriaceae bacterium]|nr:carboxypeptidase-like regulatory domain-containing protein [Cyclobacteriaceae bacterium]